MKKYKMVRNQKGFTLIEIIAVLIVLGVLAAVALPKYISLTEEARNKSALAAISEVKARANLVYGKLLLQNDGDTTAFDATDVLANSDITATPDVGVDYTVAAAATATTITITVSVVQGETLGTAVVGTWTFPS
ncbi:MAG: prepilin-type N-terminal cleavage/methylation domain-containing protein [Desulfobulbaceae bacterium]|nr:prepilin-type N-terminal cleavage/methylation domain-containing protein [Desulfobulbaceae bacterium]